MLLLGIEGSTAWIAPLPGDHRPPWPSPPRRRDHVAAQPQEEAKSTARQPAATEAQNHPTPEPIHRRGFRGNQPDLQR